MTRKVSIRKKGWNSVLSNLPKLDEHVLLLIISSHDDKDKANPVEFICEGYLKEFTLNIEGDKSIDFSVLMPAQRFNKYFTDKEDITYSEWHICEQDEFNEVIAWKYI